MASGSRASSASILASAGGDGWVARATQRGDKAVDGRGGRHDRAHRHAPCAPGAARDVRRPRRRFGARGWLSPRGKAARRARREGVGPSARWRGCSGPLATPPPSRGTSARPKRSRRAPPRPYHAARTAPASASSMRETMGAPGSALAARADSLAGERSGALREPPEAQAQDACGSCGGRAWVAPGATVP